jgi:UDP-glucuronate 4-epimerase
MKILVTGAAGFIGSHTCLRLIDEGHDVVGLDNINDYYEVELKYARLAHLGIDRSAISPQPVKSSRHSSFRFVLGDVADADALNRLAREERFDRVCHLAAQAGVRYSLVNPQAYVSSNLVGMANMLEMCRNHETGHLVYASSSSVYGLNSSIPFRTTDHTDHPASLYAATKKANELMAHSYSHLFALPTTGLRLFTVYGPWGRPDMAAFLFTRAILAGEPIDVFNEGKLQRDFTYIDDIVSAIVRVIAQPPGPGPSWNSEQPDPSFSSAPYRVYNVGNSRPVALMDFIAAIESALGRTAALKMLGMQKGDIEATWADTSDLEKDLGYKPNTELAVGIQKFVDWYRGYYGT